MPKSEVDVQPQTTYSRGYSVDFAAVCDSPAELLAEELGLTVEQAARVISWAESRALPDRADGIREVVTLLLPGARGGSVEARVGGLAAATGILARTNLSSMSALADHLTQRFRCSACGSTNTRTITRASLSHWATTFTDRLGLHNYRICRDQTARSNSRKARLKHQ